MQEQVAPRKETQQSEPKYKMKIEKDVDIPMRDGARLKADVFRPDGDGHFPVLINMGIYQKDKLWVPPHDLEEKPNPSHELGDREPGMVGAARLLLRARR